MMQELQSIEARRTDAISTVKAHKDATFVISKLVQTRAGFLAYLDDHKFDDETIRSMGKRSDHCALPPP